MPQNLPRASSSETTKKVREERRRQKIFQQKKARMTTSWIVWREFECYLEVDQAYNQAAHQLVAKISQTIALEKNTNNVVIRWDEARDRVLTLDRLQIIAERFGKSHATIFHDVAKLANHASWISGIYRRGEGGILGDVIRELRELSGEKGPEFAKAQTPVNLTAHEIKQATAKANAEFQRVEKEFRSDDPKSSPRTDAFPFLSEIDRQLWKRDEVTRLKMRVRKPRRNWRREVG